MGKKSKFTNLIALFLTFMKVGLFTFGGGYAMIPLIQKETVEKRHWISEEEIVDIIAIAESTPGPIAVNSATYIGYKVAGVLGSIFATFGLVIPSFIIIFVISLFYEQFMSIEVVKSIFKGLSVGVIVLIFSAFFKLKKSIKLNVSTTILFIVILCYLVVNYFLEINIPFFTLFLILFGFIFGIVTEVLMKGKIK